MDPFIDTAFLPMRVPPERTAFPELCTHNPVSSPEITPPEMLTVPLLIFILWNPETVPLSMDRVPPITLTVRFELSIFPPVPLSLIVTVPLPMENV